MIEPFLYRFVADRHGIEAARALCSQCGGTVVSVPATARDEHPIAKACGIDVLQALVAEFGGTKVYIPLGPTGVRGRIEAEVIARLLDGASVAETARSVGISDFSVRRIRDRVARGRL